jgi:hypothetical protein
MNLGIEPDSFAAHSLMGTPIIPSPSSVATSKHAQGLATRDRTTVQLPAGKTAKKRRKERQAWTGSVSQAYCRFVADSTF